MRDFHPPRRFLVGIPLALLLAGPVPPPAPLDELRKLLQEGRYAPAETEARKLLAAEEARNGRECREVVEVLELLVQALWKGGKSAEPETRELAERAVRGAERVFGSRHSVYANSLDNLGNVLQDLNDFSGARATFELGLIIRQGILDPEHLDLATSFHRLAVLANDTGDHARAKELYDRVLAIREKKLGRDHPDVARTLNNLALVLVQTGDYARAKSLHERALAIREAALGPGHPDVATSLHNLALLLEEAGDYRAARPMYERALAIREEVLGAQHPRVASTLNNLAILLMNLRDFAAARRLLERALAIKEKSLGADHPDVATSLENLATLFREMGEPTAAEPLHERSRAIFEKAFGPDHPAVAFSLSGLGLARQKREDYAGAKRLFERALAIRERAHGSEHPLVAETLQSLGEISYVTEKFDGARRFFERALAIREKVFGPDYAGVASSLMSLAEVDQATNNPGTALERSFQAAAILRQQFVRSARGLAEREMLAYERIRSSGLGLAFSVLTSLPPSTRPPGAAGRLWDEVVRSRALVLDEMASRNRAGFSGESPEVTALAQDLAASRKRLAVLVVRGPGAENAETYRARLSRAKEDEERLERRLAEASASFREELAESRAGLAEVGAALPPHSALVAYVEYDRSAHRPGKAERPTKGQGTVHAFAALVLRSGQRDPDLYPLDSSERIEALVRRWRDEAATAPAGLPLAGSQEEKRFREAGLLVRAAIWDPLAHSIKDSRIVFVVPDGAVNFVSLAALPTGRNSYLVETGPLLHYLSAERDLVRPGPSPEPGSSLLALGAPDFGAPPGEIDSENESTAVPSGPLLDPVLSPRHPVYRSPPADCGGFRSLRFDPLPGSAAEAAEVEARWLRMSPACHGQEARALKLTGPGASESAFKRKASSFQMLHIATHGFFLQDRCESTLTNARLRTGQGPVGLQEPWPLLGDNPLLLSGLALAGANRRGEIDVDSAVEDGVLTAEEIATLDLSGVDWAVLSACETGVGKVLKGEGVLGLRRAFEVAGAGTLIMSLWKVEDQTSREWMGNLYKNRREGFSTAEAVRRASLELIKTRRSRGRSTHPFYWGAFVAAGDWR